MPTASSCFNPSIREGFFSLICKLAEVVPIPKTYLPTSIQNDL